MICDLVKFYEGGLTFIYAEKLSYSELLEFASSAKKINDETKKVMDKKD